MTGSLLLFYIDDRENKKTLQDTARVRGETIARV